MLAVEKLRLKHFQRCDLEQLNTNKARQIKRDLRVGRTKLRKLPAGTPLKDEAIALFDTTIAAVDALANNKPDADALVVVNRECYEQYVEAVRRVMR